MEYATDPQTLTYKVVEEEGVLRIAEITSKSEYQGEKLNPIPANAMFNISTAVDGNGGNATAEQSGGTIVLNMKQNSSAVITSKFTLNFSRSFEIKGNAKIPAHDSFTIAFQDNPTKQAFYTECTNSLDPVYYGGSLGYRNNYRDGYTVSASAKDKLNHSMDSMSEGFILQYISKVEYFTSFKISGNSRIAYAANSGLSNGHYENTTKKTNELPYEIKFECTDHQTGTGKLTIVLMGKTIVYNNFIASELMPNVWKNAYLSVCSNVDNGYTGKLTMETEKYDEKVASIDTEFWADRDNNGIFETRINTTDSPALPGETILVKHNIARSDDVDFTYLENILVRQLKDITGNNNIAAYDIKSYLSGNEAITEGAERTDDAFNTDDLSKSMRISIYPKSVGDTIFEYKFVIPSANSNGYYITEQLLVGQEPFQTIYTDPASIRVIDDLSWSAPFTNTITFHTVTYDYNDGATANNVVSVLHGDQHQVQDCNVSRDGYSFTGWMSSEDNGIVQAGANLTVNSDLTLTAQWQEGPKLIPVTVRKLWDTNGHDEVIPESVEFDIYGSRGGKEYKLDSFTDDTGSVKTNTLTASDGWEKALTQSKTFLLL